MYREVSHAELSKELLEQLRQGAFLIVKSEGKVNIMTIGCGSLGFTWMRPTFTVMVRQSRYTYELMDSVKNFTVSFPLSGQLKSELAACGTASGRDIDKAAECRLSLKESSLDDTVIVDECDLHLECSIIYKHLVDKTRLNKEIKESIYRDEDYHMFYFAEIIRAYMKV